MEMRELHQKTQAILIHGITLQEVAEETLPVGTLYAECARTTDVLGQAWVRIKVENTPGNAWLYDVLPEALGYPPEA